MKKNRTFVNDLCLIAFFAVFAIVLLLAGYSSGKAGEFAVVYADGMEIARYPLYENNRCILNDGTNTLVIENGYAFISEADCPDNLCVKQGKIKYDGQCITCLPNKLTVSITGRKTDMDFVL